MRSIVPGPGRTYLYGLYGTLIALASGVTVYFEHGGGFCYEFFVASVGMVWTVIRFMKERHADNSKQHGEE